MAEEFNPYYTWLGIPLLEQPPNRYRLLGLVPFESDPHVIAHAADRQMGYVRQFQSGAHSALSQKILNELASAKICLLNAARREAYDVEFRAALDAKNAAEVPTPPVAPPPLAPEIPYVAPVDTTPSEVADSPPDANPITAETIGLRARGGRAPEPRGRAPIDRLRNPEPARNAAAEPVADKSRRTPPPADEPIPEEFVALPLLPDRVVTRRAKESPRNAGPNKSLMILMVFFVALVLAVLLLAFQPKAIAPVKDPSAPTTPGPTPAGGALPQRKSR